MKHIKDCIDSKQGLDGDVQTCMRVLNAYISYNVRTNLVSLGRGIYPPEEKGLLLNGGAELKKGYCQSIRVGWSKWP